VRLTAVRREVPPGPGGRGRRARAHARIVRAVASGGRPGNLIREAVVLAVIAKMRRVRRVRRVHG
jgi:hypothetical protein